MVSRWDSPEILRCSVESSCNGKALTPKPTYMRADVKTLNPLESYRGDGITLTQKPAYKWGYGIPLNVS
jgi:hypothetical protein